jgi:hypothetical protein
LAGSALVTKKGDTAANSSDGGENNGELMMKFELKLELELELERFVVVEMTGEKHEMGM